MVCDMYSLQKALKIVKRIDSTSVRGDVFSSVVKQNRIVRISFACYNRAPSSIKSLLLIAYGAKCFLSVRINGTGREQLLLLGAYPNEIKILAHAERLLTEFECGWFTLRKSNSIKYTSLSDFGVYLRSFGRLSSIARRLVDQLDFMPACRCFSVLAYYLRFSGILQHRDFSAVLVASHYSPESLALAAASHAIDKQVLLACHATTANSDFFRIPVYANLMACTGDAVADALLLHSTHKPEVCYLPPPLPQKKLVVPTRDADSLTIGIFLTALTDVPSLRALVSELQGQDWCETIRVRQHPAKIVQSDCSALSMEFANVQLSDSESLEHDIDACDIVICGNSTVVMETLRASRPVVYVKSLDSLPYDYARFVVNGLIPEYRQLMDESILDLIHDHYLNIAWTSKMQRFDASYLQDEKFITATMTKSVKKLIARYDTTATLNPQSELL